MSFNEFYKNNYKHPLSYKDVNKKEYSKWIGWKIIKVDKESKIIPILIENFFRVQYLKLEFKL